MYHYNICTQPDKDIFIKQCKALEKHIPDLSKDRLLDDVDGSLTQLYTLKGKHISVHNSLYIGSVYIDSEVDLERYFA